MLNRPRRLLIAFVTALLLGTGLATAPAALAAPSGPSCVQDSERVFKFCVSPATASVGDTVTLTLDYTNRGSLTLESGFGYTGSPVGTYLIGLPSGDTVACGPLGVESGCTYPLVPGGDTRTTSWPVTILAMPPDGRISFIPMVTQETRLVGVTTYDVPVLTLNVR
ncbi:hypothetical protein [Streptomyces sp. NPDC002779]|uniref:hypothetical protein n=1 Tax=Streptomyces sp. NPDC002779 TaxID=3364664 RepID=UPI0036C119D2